METVNELNTAWKAILPDWNSRSRDIGATDYTGIDPRELCGVSENGLTSFTRHDAFWRSFIWVLEESPEKHFRVLITGMSVGCELWDAGRWAHYHGLDNVTFYGHDLMESFTQRAAAGVYPLRFVCNWGPEVYESFDLETPYPGYASVKQEIRDMVEILPSSSILDLEGQYDVVVSHLMNPIPPGCDQALIARGDHLVIKGRNVLKTSEWFDQEVSDSRFWSRMLMYNFD